MELMINGQVHVLADAAVAPEMPLLWALRDVLNLTGTKFGCGVAAQRVTTIEALGSAERPHALQKAWVLHQVPQCGYCQSGMIMAVAELLKNKPKPTDADICLLYTSPSPRD